VSFPGKTKVEVLAVGIVLAVVILVAFSFRSPKPRALGRLVLLKQVVIGSDFAVRLRWERPDQRLGVGNDCLLGKDETGTLWKVSAGWDESKQELSFIAPTNTRPRWFVETEVFEPIKGISKAYLRAQLSLTSKNLSPLREDIGPFWRKVGTVKSDYITNTLLGSDARATTSRRTALSWFH
jgi:hypothetical protein